VDEGQLSKRASQPSDEPSPSDSRSATLEDTA